MADADTTGGGVWKVILSIFAIIGVIIIGLYGAKWITANINNFDWAQSTSQHPYNPPHWLGETLSTIISDLAAQTWEGLILSLAVMLILVLAFADILESFSSFSKMTSNLIAIGLALIAGVSRMVEGILVWLGITAGVGAIAMGVIILNAFIIAIVVNFLFGRVLINKIKNAKTEKEIEENSRSIRKRMGALGSWAKVAQKEAEE
ncbi:MAG: hypothetical protein ACOCUU_02035 [Nanoarchaeota archaeon]